MNNLQKFDFNNSELNIEVDEKGNIWFRAKDICDILSLKNSTNAILGLNKEEHLTLRVLMSGQNRNMLFISESGLYKLILKSHQKVAKRFQDWVTKEILPSIRKTGEYLAPQSEDEKILEVVGILQTRIKNLNNKCQMQQIKIESDKPKVEFADDFMATPQEMSVTTLAGKMNVNRNDLFEFLHLDRWVRATAYHPHEPYAKHRKEGLLRLRDYHVKHKKMTVPTLYITQKGQEAIAMRWRERDKNGVLL